MGYRGKRYTIFVLLFLICLLSAVSVFAEGEDPSVSDPALELRVSDSMLDILNQNLENLFPITVMRRYFNTPAEALYSDDGLETVIEIENYKGKRKIRMFANADHINDHLAIETIDESYMKDFQLTMDVTVRDTWPMGQGGCLIGFTNYGVSAYYGAKTVAIISDGRNAEIYFKNREDPSGIHFPLEIQGKISMKLSIVHLTGHTYVYIDGKYAGQLHDGLDGTLRMLYGAALFTEGDSAACTFDNLTIKKLGINR